MAIMTNQMGNNYNKNQLELIANSQRCAGGQIGGIGGNYLGGIYGLRNIQQKEKTNDLDLDYQKYIEVCNKAFSLGQVVS